MITQKNRAWQLLSHHFLSKAGYFEPTPGFDQPMDMDEAVTKRIISRGAWYNHGGPWVHLDEEGNLVNRADSR